MNIIALILVFDASILASMSQPDLPDDFQKSSGESVVVEQPKAVPSITFEAGLPAKSGIVETKATVKERWLVSEPWCANCPAAKARFKAAGGKDENIISIADALRLHGKVIDSVPREYTTDKELTLLNPAEYRRIPEMQVHLVNTGRPTKQAILDHLRNGDPHQKKHWQAWSLESWDREQLYALHDDDHAGNVPTFDVEPPVVAAVSGAQLTPDVIAAALAVHLHQSQGLPAPAFGSLFDISVDAPDSVVTSLAAMLSKQSVEFPNSGLAISWKGGDRTISVAPGRIQITPGATVSAQKFGVSLSTILRGVAHADDLSWITLELDGAPDLTVRLK
jgi:hypothetical protein